MNRRNFIALGSAALAALPVAALAARNPLQSAMGAASPANPPFSLEILTDDPAYAAGLAADLLRTLSGTISYTESTFAGSHRGDIVFILNNNLIDFYQGGSSHSGALRSIARRLRLPRMIDNPSLVRFTQTNEAALPGKINVYSGGVLRERFDYNAAPKDLTIKGLRGNVDIRAGGGAARVLDSSCTHKTCLSRGSINRPGESIVCIPNDIRITID